MNAIGFVVSFVIFVAGLYLMGIAFDVSEDLGFVTVGVFIPVHIMKRIDH